MSANMRTLPTSIAAGAAVSQMTLVLDVNGSNINATPLPPVLQNLQSLPSITYVGCVAGNNTVTLPMGAVGVICYNTDDATTIAWSVKADAGSAGMAQSPKGVFMQTFPSSGAPASFIVNAAGEMTLACVWF